MIKVFRKVKSVFTSFISDNFLDFSNSILWLFVIFASGILFAYIAFPNPTLNILKLNIYFLIAIFSVNILFHFIKKIITKTHSQIFKFSNRLENFSDVLRVTSLIVFAFAIGSLRMNARTYFLDTPMIKSKMSDILISGKLVNVEFFPNKYRLIVDDVSSSKLPENIRKIILNISIDGYEKSDIKVGDNFMFIANLNPLSRPVFVGDFNYTRYSFYRKISGSGHVDKIISVHRNNNESFIDFIKNFRFDMTKYIKSNMSKNAGDVALTLITGERHAVGKKIQNNYKKSGVSHLLAISGFHMTIIAGIVFLMVRFLLALIYPISSKYDVKNFAYFITLIALTCYLFLSGARLSTQRAYIMAVAGLCAFMMGKSPVSIRLLLLAGLVILTMTPEAIVNAGFGLSFLAVMALITVFRLPVIVNYGYRLRRKSPIYHWIFMAFLTASVASFATSILTLYHFKEYPVWSVVTNVITTPIFVLLVMPTVVSFLIFNNLLPFFGLNLLSLKLLDLSIELINSVTDFMAKIPYKTVFVNYMSEWVVCLFVVGFLMIVLLKTKYKIVGFVLTIISMFFIYSAPMPDIIINRDGDVFIVQSRWKVIGFNIFTVENNPDDSVQNYDGGREDLRKRIGIAMRFGTSTKNLNFIKYSVDDEFYINNMLVKFFTKNINETETICAEIYRWKISNKYCLNHSDVMEIYFRENNYKTRFQ